QRAYEARMRVIRDLDAHVVRFREALEARGGQAYLARTADEATAYVVDVCRRHGAKLAAKSKTMASEEIGLNTALEAAGVRAVETGSVVLVTNEGNGRLVSSLPRVHIAIMGMERLVADLADLAVLLRLLGRSGTGQRLTTYTTLVTGPRRPGEQDGPDELHVVVLDNGRSNLVG